MQLSLPITLTGGWCISTANVEKLLPFALITFIHSDGNERNSRLDLDKMMFIDNLPVEIKKETVEKFCKIISKERNLL